MRKSQTSTLITSAKEKLDEAKGYIHPGQDRPIALVESVQKILDSLDPSKKVEDDRKKAASLMSAVEARYVVDFYYMIQENRKRAANQAETLSESHQPNNLISWLLDSSAATETQIKNYLDVYSDKHIEGRWAKSITGIGPVIAAGLLAHIDITQAPTVGHIWRFAGLDPTDTWLGRELAEQLVKDVAGTARVLTDGHLAELALRRGDDLQVFLEAAKDSEGRITRASVIRAMARRPWNASLKTLCWKIGESFVKFSNLPDCLYGKLYQQRKALEEERNEKGLFKAQAEQKLARVKIGKDTIAYQHYSKGRLPPAHIHSRAKRWATKIFLAHYHHVVYEVHYQKPPPKPYVLEHVPGHHHAIVVPNWPMK